MSMSTLYLKYKSNYGNEPVAYPNCKTSLAITKLLGTKTIPPKHMGVLKEDLGYTILFLGIDYTEKDIKDDWRIK